MSLIVWINWPVKPHSFTFYLTFIFYFSKIKMMKIKTFFSKTPGYVLKLLVNLNLNDLVKERFLWKKKEQIVLYRQRILPCEGKALRIIPSPVKRIEGRCKKVSFNLLLLLVTKKIEVYMLIWFSGIPNFLCDVFHVKITSCKDYFVVLEEDGVLTISQCFQRAKSMFERRLMSLKYFLS